MGVHIHADVNATKLRTKYFLSGGANCLKSRREKNQVLDTLHRYGKRTIMRSTHGLNSNISRTRIAPHAPRISIKTCQSMNCVPVRHLCGRDFTGLPSLRNTNSKSGQSRSNWKSTSDNWKQHDRAQDYGAATTQLSTTAPSEPRNISSSSLDTKRRQVPSIVQPSSSCPRTTLWDGEVEYEFRSNHTLTHCLHYVEHQSLRAHTSTHSGLPWVRPLPLPRLFYLVPSRFYVTLTSQRMSFLIMCCKNDCSEVCCGSMRTRHWKSTPSSILSELQLRP